MVERSSGTAIESCFVGFTNGGWGELVVSWVVLLLLRSATLCLFLYTKQQC